MVKKRSKGITQDCASKGFYAEFAGSNKISASTPYGTCTERLSPFGGLLLFVLCPGVCPGVGPGSWGRAKVVSWGRAKVNS